MVNKFLTIDSEAFDRAVEKFQNSHVLPEAPNITNYVMPKCAKCRNDVQMCVTSVSTDKLTMVFTCHNEKRRIDISLAPFLKDIEAARQFIVTNCEWLFSEEQDWQDIIPHSIEIEENVAKKALADWLSNDE